MFGWYVDDLSTLLVASRDAFLLNGFKLHEFTLLFIWSGVELVDDCTEKAEGVNGDPTTYVPLRLRRFSLQTYALLSRALAELLCDMPVLSSLARVSEEQEPTW